MNETSNYLSLVKQRRGLLLPVVAPLGELAAQETQQIEQHLVRVADQMRDAADLAYAVYGAGYARIIAAELASYQQELGDLRRELDKRGR